jgi:site-specific recombinase XerD
MYSIIRPVTRCATRSAVLAALVDVGQRLESNHAANTKKAYARDFTDFADWCATVPLPALPAAPETVYLYLSALVADDNAAGYAVSTLDRRLAAIGWVHESSSHDNPCRHARIRQLMSGIRGPTATPRSSGTRSRRSSWAPCWRHWI